MSGDELRLGEAHRQLMRENLGTPRIVCLCGSTRFHAAFQKANYDETMAGRIVLGVGFCPHSSATAGHGEGVGHDSDQKRKLDRLHFRKIELALLEKGKVPS